MSREPPVIDAVGEHPEIGGLWGSIPRTYSAAGIINSAMRLSTKWEDVWCRD